MSSAAASSTPNVAIGAPSTHFVLSGQAGASKREMLTKPRAEELFAPLINDQAKAETISKIVLGGKSFGTDSAPVLAATLLNTHSLTHADFSDCIAGRNTDEALVTLQLLCDGIAANERIQLTHLNLSDNALGVRSIPKIKSAFKNQSKLLHLYFNNDGLQAEAVTALTALIMENYGADATTQLRTLEIGDNCLEDAGFSALIPLVKASPLLQTLRIATTRVRNNLGAGLAMSKTLLGLKHLTSLSLNDNNLGAEAGVQLAQVIRNNADHLAFLNLGDIGVEETGVEAIMKAIADIKPNTLVHLDLSANELTSSHAHARLLASIVSRQRESLKHLKLEDNELKSRGAIKLLRALSHCKNLSYLNLTNNHLGPRSAKEVLGFLAAMPSLKEIHLNGNHFKIDTLQEIKDVVEQVGTHQGLATMSDNEEESDEEEESEEEEDNEEAAEDKDVDALAAGLAATTVSK